MVFPTLIGGLALLRDPGWSVIPSYLCGTNLTYFHDWRQTSAIHPGSIPRVTTEASAGLRLEAGDLSNEYPALHDGELSWLLTFAC